MALTAEQLDQLEFQAKQLEITSINETRRVRGELVRLAKEILTENNRSKELSERDITAGQIIEMATSLQDFINSK